MFKPLSMVAETSTVVFVQASKAGYCCYVLTLRLKGDLLVRSRTFRWPDVGK
jgi:hypothetical protein